MHGDVTFTLTERSEIAFANEWIADRVGRSPYVLVWDLPHPADGDEVADGPSIRRGQAPSQPSWAAGYKQSRARVSVSPDDRDLEFEIVVAHELGHTWGLRHHPGPGVMNLYHSDLLEWTDDDREACRAQLLDCP